jgi:hypothetical protein
VDSLNLNLAQDINDRMPREEAQALFDIIKPIGMSYFLFPSALY